MPKERDGEGKSEKKEKEEMERKKKRKKEREMKIKEITEERKEGFPIKDRTEEKRGKKQSSINEGKRAKVLQARLPLRIIRLAISHPT